MGTIEKHPAFVKVATSETQEGMSAHIKGSTEELFSKGWLSLNMLDEKVKSVFKSSTAYRYTYLDGEGDLVLVANSKDLAVALADCDSTSLQLTARSPDTQGGETQGSPSGLKATIESLKSENERLSLVVKEAQSRANEALRLKDQEIGTLKMMIEVQVADKANLCSEIDRLRSKQSEEETKFCYNRPAGRPLAIRSVFDDTYLKATAGNDGTVSSVGWQKSWETWSFFEVGESNKWAVYNKAHGTYLSACETRMVRMATCIRDSELFEIVDLGNGRVAFKSHAHGAYLRRATNTASDVDFSNRIARETTWVVEKLA